MMATHIDFRESRNTISEKSNFSSHHFQSQLVEERIEDCPVENQNNFSIPIWEENDHQHDDHQEDQSPEPQFKISLERLGELVEHQSGSIHEIIEALETNIESGILGDGRDLARRHQAFGSNQTCLEDQLHIFHAKGGGFYGLALEAFKDTSVVLLLCCATLSLAIGMKRNGPQEGFLDGLVLFVTIFIVVNVSVICKYCKAIYMKKLSSRHQKVNIEVIRRGEMQQIPASEIVVGDILCLKAGDQVTADGLFIRGDSFKTDDNLVLRDGLDIYYYHKHPCIFNGAKVVGGTCRMLVTSVGLNTERSKLMRLRSSSSLQTDEGSNWQISIDKMNSRMEKVFLSLSILVLVVQLLRCFVGSESAGCQESQNPDPKGVKNAVEEILKIEANKLMRKQETLPINGLVSMLCILLFSIRDGLPLGIFISLFCASKKMKSFGVMVQKLAACATIGLATTICTNGTSDLTLRPEEMAELRIGLNSNDDVSKGIPREILNMLWEGVEMNASADFDLNECAISFWAKQVLVDVNVDPEELSGNSILHSEAFDNLRVLLLSRNGEAGKVVHWKGAPEMVLPMCSHFYNLDGSMQTLDEQTRAEFKKIFQNLSSDSLKCFAFAYKKVVIPEEEKASIVQEEVADEEPKPEIEPEPEPEPEPEQESLGFMRHGLTMLGLIRLKNPYTPELIKAVEFCHDSGVKIKLLVGEDMNMATLMGINSGILEPGENTSNGILVTEASEFRNSLDDKEELKGMIDKTSVISNCSPSDKLLAVQCLRQKGEVVIVTGTSSRDSVSLKEADVGLSLWNNETAEKNSDIVGIEGMTSDILTISELLKVGRSAMYNLQKLIQLQLTINIAAYAINLIILLCSCEVPLGPFELLWVNMVMESLGALAINTELDEAQSPPSSLNHRNLISKSMWRNIVVQSVYQVIVLLILNFKGGEVIAQIRDQKVLEAMMFNCFVLCQVFVLINAREIEKTNVFQGMMVIRLKKNKYCLFFVLVLTIVILQVAVAEIASAVTHGGRLHLKEWCICMGIASFSLPIGWVAKLV